MNRTTGLAAGEAKALAMEAREEATCHGCDHDEWEDLDQVPSTHLHSCSEHQAPDPNPILLCGDCREDHTPSEDWKQSKKESDRTYVLYECGIARTPNERFLTPEGGPEGYEVTETTIPVKCRCGAQIETVFY